MALAGMDADQLKQAREAWAYLHIETYFNRMTEEKLKQVRAKIPRGCGCPTEWDTDLAANPLPREGQFEWGVIRHNNVNARRKVRGWTLDEALEFWSAQALQILAKTPAGDLQTPLRTAQNANSGSEHC